VFQEVMETSREARVDEEAAALPESAPGGDCSADDMEAAAWEDDTRQHVEEAQAAARVKTRTQGSPASDVEQRSNHPDAEEDPFTRHIQADLWANATVTKARSKEGADGSGKKHFVFHVSASPRLLCFWLKNASFVIGRGLLFHRVLL
jgi:hypothetical protein